MPKPKIESAASMAKLDPRQTTKSTLNLRGNKDHGMHPATIVVTTTFKNAGGTEETITWEGKSVSQSTAKHKNKERYAVLFEVTCTKGRPAPAPTPPTTTSKPYTTGDLVVVDITVTNSDGTSLPVDDIVLLEGP